MKPFTEMTDDEKIAEVARRADRRSRGLPLEETPAEAAARIADVDRRREKDIQRDIRRLYLAHGCTVYWLSQARETGQTAGLGDLFVFCRKAQRAWWHEVKTPTGDLSPAQLDFQNDCDWCHVGYVYGGLAAAEAKLRAIGVWI